MIGWDDDTNTMTTTITVTRVVQWFYRTATATNYPAPAPDLRQYEREQRAKDSQIIARLLEPVRRLWGWLPSPVLWNLQQPSPLEARRHARKRYIQKLRMA